MIRTAIVAVFLTLYTLIAGPFLLLHAWISGNPDLLFHAGVSGGYFIARVVGIRMRIEGREKIPSGVCLFIANHTSFVDPVPILWAIHRRVAVLLKKSLFSVPLIGWAFRLAKFVPVDRGNRQKGIASMDVATARLKQGTSFLAYPEGTRSYDGRLLPFNKGVFGIAIEAGVPVVPMVLIGAHRIAPKGSLKINSGELIVRFGDPIETKGYSIEQRGDLTDRVRVAMVAMLPADQQPD